jgi:hypothetical protein
MRTRPTLRPIGNEMRRWCAVLEREISVWPHVTTRPMFGMVAFYRGAKIFAAIPRTRAAESENSILIKLPRVKDEQLRGASGPGAGWATFSVDSEKALPTALEWLERAYRKAK